MEELGKELTEELLENAHHDVHYIILSLIDRLPYFVDLLGQKFEELGIKYGKYYIFQWFVGQRITHHNYTVPSREHNV